MNERKAIAPTTKIGAGVPQWVIYWISRGVTPRALEKAIEKGKRHVLSRRTGIPDSDMDALAERWGINYGALDEDE